MYSCHVKWSTDRNVRSKQENTFGACGQEKAMLPVSSIGGERGVAHRCELRSMDPTSSAVRQLGDTLYNLRITAGLTQQQLAALTGGRWSRSHIGRVENGDVTPSPDFVEAIDGATKSQPGNRGTRPIGPLHSTWYSSARSCPSSLPPRSLRPRAVRRFTVCPAAVWPAIVRPVTVRSATVRRTTVRPVTGWSAAVQPTWTRPTSARFRARGAGTDRTGTEGSGIEVHRQPVTVPPYDPVDRARRRHGVGAPHPAGGGPRGRPGHPRAARQPLVPPRRLPPGQDAPRDRLAARPGGRPQRPGRMGARRAEHGRAV